MVRGGENTDRTFGSIDEVLAFAIEQEQKAERFYREFVLDDSGDQQDLLIAAMRSEKKAEKLYRDLAAASEDTTLRDLFTRLADEEGTHKDVLEKTYDDEILDQN